MNNPLDFYKQDLANRGENIDNVLKDFQSGIDPNLDPTKMLSQLGVTKESFNSQLELMDSKPKENKQQYAKPHDMYGEHKPMPTAEEYQLLQQMHKLQRGNLNEHHHNHNEDYVLVSKSDLKNVILETLIEVVPKMTTKLENDAIEATVKHFIQKYTKKNR